MWSWWRQFHQSSKSPSPSFHYNILQRRLRQPKSLHCTLPLTSWEWLVSHFPSVPVTPRVVHDSFVSVPIILLSRLLMQYDILFTSTDRPTARSQFTSPPSHTWNRCRHAAPKIARHTGVIRSSSGVICKTTADFDLALRATRSFWQESPCPYDPAWSSLLHDYASSTSPFPFCPPPTHDNFIMQLSPPRILLLAQMASHTPHGGFVPLYRLRLWRIIFRIYYTAKSLRPYRH